MKPLKLIILAIALLTCTKIKADNGIKVWRPTFNGGFNQTQAAITNPLVEVTPKGVYAEIALTFTINAAYMQYQSTDSLEAILEFDLPTNSFIHDSWLWLDDVNIIRADIMERAEATQTYNNQVKRVRRDPSLLLKNGPNHYTLNVWPLTIDYPRKVKIVYSAPFEWTHNGFTVPLPVNIFSASKILPDIHLKVNHDAWFAYPRFVGADYPAMTKTSSPIEDSLVISSGTYQYMPELNLVYSPPTPNGVFLSTYPVNQDEGYYQLAVNPELMPGNTYEHRNITVILDHTTYQSTKYSIEYIKESIAGFLLKNYSAKDSFNVFYIESGVQRAFSGWQAIDEAAVYTALNDFDNYQNFNSQQFEQLLKEGLSFAGTRQETNSYVVLYTDNNSVKDTTAANGVFNTVMNYMGGSFKNRVFILNNNSYTNFFSITANAHLLKKISAASSGQYYHVIDEQQTTITDMLKSIAGTAAYRTISYNVALPLPNGFAYSIFDINGSHKFNPSSYYVETGKYYGAFNINSDVKIEYLAPSGYQTIQQKPGSVMWGEDNLKKAWTNKYLVALIGQNNSGDRQEILDSSINNRVLCDKTAFIALDNGDTIQFQDDNIATAVPEKEHQKDVVKAYPNPFTNNLTIKLPAGAELVTVYDVMGRIVFEQKIEKDKKQIVWDGRDKNGNSLPAGVYMLTVRTASGRTTLKLLKQ